jgi:hypothetical protein
MPVDWDVFWDTGETEGILEVLQKGCKGESWIH